MDAAVEAEPEIEVPEEVETALEQLFGSLQDKVGDTRLRSLVYPMFIGSLV